MGRSYGTSQLIFKKQSHDNHSESLLSRALSGLRLEEAGINGPNATCLWPLSSWRKPLRQRLTRRSAPWCCFPTSVFLLWLDGSICSNRLTHDSLKEVMVARYKQHDSNLVQAGFLLRHSQTLMRSFFLRDDSRSGMN